MTTATTDLKSVRVIAWITIIFGIIFIVAGGVTWGAVASNLAAQKITVSDDAAAFGGQLVDTPWEAFAQAEVINKHATEISGGKTYAELPQDDPNRPTVMTASFLQASLFTAVVAFGVALLVVGVGVTLILIGAALRRIGAVRHGEATVVETGPAAPARAYPDPIPTSAPTAPPAATTTSTPLPPPSGPTA